MTIFAKPHVARLLYTSPNVASLVKLLRNSECTDRAEHIVARTSGLSFIGPCVYYLLAHFCFRSGKFHATAGVFTIEQFPAW